MVAEIDEVSKEEIAVLAKIREKLQEIYSNVNITADIYGFDTEEVHVAYFKDGEEIELLKINRKTLEWDFL